MKISKSTIAFLVSVLSVAFVGSVTMAREDGAQDRARIQPEVTQTAGPEKKPLDKQKQEVAERREKEIKDRLEKVRQARLEKLDDKRLQACEKKEDKINQIVERSVEQNQKQLEVFERIAEKVRAFYADKKLTSDMYAGASDIETLARAEARAALTATKSVSFDCSVADGADPVRLMKESMTARQTALKSYRTAVKDLILAVKNHNDSVGPEAAGAENQNPSETVDSTDATRSEDTEGDQ